MSNLQFLIEEWKPIVCYEGYYEVSSFGNIRSLDKYIKSPFGKLERRFLKGKSISVRPDSKDRYIIVDLFKDTIRRTCLVHRIVGLAFLGLTPELEINHKDGNTKNNNVNNLEVVTRSENEIHKYRVLKIKHPFIGRVGTMHSCSKPVIKYDLKTGEDIEQFDSIRLAESKGYKNSCITLCCQKKQHTHKGFGWKYA